ncbi:MAG: pyridoxal-phosphate dependent enzyme [Gaiellaceae bacterium]
MRTPLVRLDDRIWLKLENLQPIGSFKLRGAANAVLSSEVPAEGLWTASAGNMSQGVAWCARLLGVPCSVIVPEGAAQTKLERTRALGADVIEVSFDEWWEVFRTREREGMRGLFVHAFADPLVIEGNGTIGSEIVEDLPGVDAIVAPFGGGGLACGIASAVDVPVYAAEVDTGAPLAPSLAAGEPVEVEYRHTFVDGIGGPVVLPEMFELAQKLLAGSIVVSVDAAAAGVRTLAERARVVAEGAAGAGLAAAGQVEGDAVVVVVSGGNIDLDVLARILRGEQLQ